MKKNISSSVLLKKIYYISYFCFNVSFVNASIAPIILNFSPIKQYFHMFIMSKMINQNTVKFENYINIVSNEIVNSIQKTNLMFKLDETENIDFVKSQKNVEKFKTLLHELGHLNGAVNGFINLPDDFNDFKKKVSIYIYKEGFSRYASARIYVGMSQLPKNTIKMFFSGPINDFLVKKAFIVHAGGPNFSDEQIGKAMNSEVEDYIKKISSTEYMQDFFNANQLIHAYNLTENDIRKIANDSVQTANKHLSINVLYAYCLYNLIYDVSKESYNYIKGKQKELGIKCFFVPEGIHLRLNLNKLNPFIENNEQEESLIDVCINLIANNNNIQNLPELKIATIFAKSAVISIKK